MIDAFCDLFNTSGSRPTEGALGTSRSTQRNRKVMALADTCKTAGHINGYSSTQKYCSGETNTKHPVSPEGELGRIHIRNLFVTV